MNEKEEKKKKEEEEVEEEKEVEEEEITCNYNAVLHNTAAELYMWTNRILQ